jgi:putative heme-binding domain-containing protein
MKSLAATALTLTVLGAGTCFLLAADAEPAAPAGPRNYDTTELTRVVNPMLRGGRDFAEGERVFNTIGCRLCHLFGGGAGGIGPDISGVGGRFGTFEILQSILEPDVVISDLYGMKEVETTDGKWYRGRLVPINDEEIGLVENFSVDPNSMSAYWGPPTVRIKYADISWMEDSWTSPMPAGMINGLTETEVANMMAYLISGGDPSNRMFRELPAETK